MALLDKAIKRTGAIEQARLQHLLALLTGKARRNASPPTEQAAEEYILHLLTLLKDSGIYALSSMASPLVALVLAPFLTRYLSRTEYGALAVLNITISLIAACTQLGMATSFFRAYNWDYEAQGDRFAIFTTSLLLLLLVSTPALIVMYICAPWLSALLLGSAAFSSALKITGLVIFVQNLALPLLLWLRAEKRALLFSLLSICNLLVTLVATLFFVGVLHMGINGSLFASAGGYLILVLSICPVVFSQLKKGLSMRPRMDITHNLLRFGIPIVFSAVAAWALQLSDRYLLTYLGSLAQTASYTVAYSLGGALAPIILTPFGMAWPPAMYAIAKREDAPRLFQLVFRWYSIVLFLFNFVLSLLGIALLYLLFPPVYRPIAPLIPIISLSYTFYGIYYVVSVGTYIRRKTSLIIFFTTSAAGVNILLNFFLIPLYGPLGAALATLFAFMLLAAIAYIVNQRLYPLPLEIGIFWLALCIGVGLFVGGVLLARVLPLYQGWAVLLCALILYGICLLALGRLPVRKRGYGRNRRYAMATVSHQDRVRVKDASKAPAIKVCMHVLGPARTDVRVMRAATTLLAAGYAVSVVDIAAEEEHIQREETAQGVAIHHVGVSHGFSATRFERRAVLRALLLFLRCAWRLLRAPADIYHAHDVSSLPACYLASLIRRKPLVYEAHEMPLFERPLSGMSRGQRLVHRMLAIALAHIIPRCAGVITVSPPIVEELRRRYSVSSVTLLRNLPEYQEVPRSDRLRQRLGLAPETRIVLYQGNLQPNRELDRLVRAAPFLAPDTVLVMMGKDMKSTALQLRTLIAEEGVEERVKILPAVPYEELLSWTTSADMGLAIFAADYSLNVSMFLPNKLFEYIMAGTPVLASQIKPIVEVIETYKVGRVVPSLAPAAIAQTINEMLADEQALTVMRRNALEAARAELCWEKERPRLIALYQTICRRQSSNKMGAPSMEERKG